MIKLKSGYRMNTRATALLVMTLFLFATFGCGLVIQGLIIMRSEVIEDPFTWASNMVAGIVLLGIALPALGGFLMWWNAPAGAVRVEPTAPANALFKSGKLLGWFGIALSIVSMIGSTQ